MIFPKKMPRAFALEFKNPWLVALILMVAVVLWSVATFVKNTTHERELLERTYLMQGEGTIRRLTREAYRSWDLSQSGRMTPEEASEDYRLMLASDTRASFVALTDMHGNVRMSSAPDVLGPGNFSDPLPPEAFVPLRPRAMISEAAGNRVFWAYRPLLFSSSPMRAAIQTDRPAHRTGSSRQPASQEGPARAPRRPVPGEPSQQPADVPGSDRPEDTFYLWIGYDMEEFDEQESAERSRTIVATGGTCLISLILILLLIYLHDRDVSRHLLGNAEIRAQKIISSIGSGLFLTDTDGVVTMANREAERISGLPRASIVGKSLGDIIVSREEMPGGRCLGDLVCARGKAAGGSDGQPADGEFAAAELDVSFRGDGGLEATVSISAGTYFTHDRQEAGRLVLMTDVSGMVRLRREAAARERLAELGRMARQVSHDIRNHLSSGKCSIQHLLRKIADEDVDPAHFGGLLEIALSSMERIHATADNVLSYGRPSEIHCRREDLGKLLLNARKLAEYSGDKGGTDLKAGNEADGPVMAMVDKAKFSDVLQNLFQNALQAVAGNPPDRPGMVAAEVSVNPEGEAEVLFLDNGPGFPPSQLENPFRPDFTTKETGHGLGLSNAEEIVRAHGGTVTLANWHREDARDGDGVPSVGGAAVTITLPLAPAEAAAETVAETEAEAGTGAEAGAEASPPAREPRWEGVRGHGFVHAERPSRPSDEGEAKKAPSARA
ncbi:MAG: PAS domain-containing protein [Deltaproteobacteria bacterium]|jgi:signal transduction histidine kinase|nr:PAS domain-containing protein [Deltaproteobacteria bacterium]